MNNTTSWMRVTLSLAMLMMVGCHSCQRSEVPPPPPAAAPTPNVISVRPTPAVGTLRDDLTLFVEAEPEEGEAPLTVQFTAESLADPSVTGTWTWDFGDSSPPSSEPAPKHTYQQPGTYTVKVRLVAEDGMQGYDEVDVTVQAPGVAAYGANSDTLRLFAEAEPESGPPPLTVTFSAESLADPDMQDPKYTWNFGDGSAVSHEPKPMHVFERRGTFMVVVTVVDANGNQGRDELEITVE